MFSRCGYCHRDGSVLIPVLVSSRGKQIESFACPSCISRWKKIANVRINENHPNFKQVEQWLENRQERQRQAERRYEERKRQNSKRCARCGEPIDRHSERCIACARGNVDYTLRGKITPEDAEKIRGLRGKMTLKEIARLFGISFSNVSLIHNNKTWRQNETERTPSDSTS